MEDRDQVYRWITYSEKPSIAVQKYIYMINPMCLFSCDLGVEELKLISVAKSKTQMSMYVFK